MSLPDRNKLLTQPPQNISSFVNISDIVCPLCGSNSNRIFKTHDYWLRDCQACGHRFTEIEWTDNHLREVYSELYFKGGGAGYSDYLSEAELLRASGYRYGKLAAQYAGATGRVLDVGAAAGFILQGFEQAGWRGNGIEPNYEMYRFAEDELGVNVENCSVENFESREQFELISLIQVIAHLPKPREILQKLSRLTKKDGHLLIETWRRDSLTARLFGRHWHEYSPPSVLHWFTGKRLQSLVEEAGFRVIATGRPVKRVNAAHAKSLLTYKLRQISGGKFLSQGLFFIPDNILIPYPAEDLFWLLCQKIG